jgi:phenylalanyl-tRNA synthetase alpha subunit
LYDTKTKAMSNEAMEKLVEQIYILKANYETVCLANEKLNELLKVEAGEDTNIVKRWAHKVETLQAENDRLKGIEAKHKALEQAVNDAIELSTENYNLNINGSPYQRGYAHGIGKVIETIKEKTWL